MVLTRVAAATLAWLVAAVAGAGSHSMISGRVELHGDPPPVAPRPRVAALGMPPGPIEVVDRRQAVVYLEEAPRRAFEESERGHVVLDQRNESFLPHVLAITVGTTVDFVNSDALYHNVFSLSKAKRFDLGRYPRGQRKSVLFDSPGVVRVFCEIHSHMSAFILVFAHRYFALTQSDGRYRIEDVPPGNYTVVAWHEGESRASRSVEVRPNESVELDFVLP
jgi:plastocyanin